MAGDTATGPMSYQNEPVPGPRIRRSKSSVLETLSIRKSAMESDPQERLPLPPRDDGVIAQALTNTVELGTRRLPPTPIDATVQARHRPETSGLHRLVRTLRKRRQAGDPSSLANDHDHFDNFVGDKTFKQRIRHKKSESWPSSTFITAVRSAGDSLSTLSAGRLPRKTDKSKLYRSSRDSRRSQTFSRSSVDSAALQHLDDLSVQRASKRQQTMNELCTSEENYIADLRMLVNAYHTLHQSSTASLRSKIKQILPIIHDILTLHEALLLAIRPAIARAAASTGPTRMHTRLRGRSTDSSSLDNTQAIDKARLSADDQFRCRHTLIGVELLGLREVIEVAEAFQTRLCRFFVYEEYGLRYESMLYDMTFASKAIPNWQAYEKGLESLANSLAPTGLRDASSTGRKGLTLGDLLIKPLQRVCRYPLLFQEILKSTPVVDDPEAHHEVEKVLFRLRETAAEINRSTNDEYARNKMKRTWDLQDMLTFPDPLAAPFKLRVLGHPILCGALHVAYQSTRLVTGGYMLCVLFKSCLILAVPAKALDRPRLYKIVASISLADVHIESCENGKGMQCFSALHSWKLVFEASQQLFEVLLSAASSEEEEQWRQNLLTLSAEASQAAGDYQVLSSEHYSILMMDLRPLGSILGHQGTLARRLSVQRAATVGARSHLCQVVIRDTHTPAGELEVAFAARTHLGRSRSLLSTRDRVPVLAPKRSERTRIEQDMANVWTKELLPYPGMKMPAREHLVRGSASSVMRKISRTSLGSSISKRTVSHRSARLRSAKGREPTNMQTPVDESQRWLEESVQDVYPAHSFTVANHTSDSDIGKLSSVSLGDHSSAVVQTSENFHQGSTQAAFDENIVGTTHQNKNAKDSVTNLKARWSSPASLLGAFSNGGIRALFV